MKIAVRSARAIRPSPSRSSSLFSSLFAMSLALVASPSLAAASDDLARLEGDYETWFLRENPTVASTLGIRDYDTKIRDAGFAAMDRRAAANAEFLRRLEGISPDDLSFSDRVNRAILNRIFSEAVQENKFGQRAMLFTTYYGWHQGFVGMADELPFRTRDDYESYLARLTQYPTLNDASLDVTAEAVKRGYVLPCVVLEGFEKGISGVVSDDPVKSRFYAPFLRPRPVDVSDELWIAMQAKASDLIVRVINPAYRKHASFFLKSYAPNCATSPSVSAQPGGREYYAFRIRQETTTSLSADEIHQIGLAEVARIGAEMEAVARKSGYATSAAMIAEMRTDEKYFAKSPEEFLSAAALISKTIDGFMPTLFTRLARLPYGIRPIPGEIAERTVTASYGPGSPEGGVSGTFFLNTSRLDQRPLWELPALASHEGVPGHHQQIALQQELNLPIWRRYGSRATAFVEGWALYSEQLGIAAGLYDTPEKNMGRLSYEMWRACRLVVDTGIHSKGWSKDRAVNYMKSHTALTDANIDAEINRYISWPGQALAYKLGELKIVALQQRARSALGTRFDLRRFNDAILSEGAVPLDVLEEQIDDWISKVVNNTGGRHQ